MVANHVRQKTAKRYWRAPGRLSAHFRESSIDVCEARDVMTQHFLGRGDVEGRTG